MKKLLSIFTAFAMLLCLASCGGEATNDESPSTEQPLNTAKTQQELLATRARSPNHLPTCASLSSMR